MEIGPSLTHQLDWINLVTKKSKYWEKSNPTVKFIWQRGWWNDLGLEDLKGLFQILVANALRHHIAQALLLVFLVVGEVALKPNYLRIAFKSQDVRTNTI
jgi:hypothetical protein